MPCTSKAAALLMLLRVHGCITSTTTRTTGITRLFADGFTPKGSQVEAGAVEMPQRYALEMVADWMGASYAYTNSWDMADWLTKNMPRIRVHSKTAAYLRGVLDTLGYADIVYMQKFDREQT